MLKLVFLVLILVLLCTWQGYIVDEIMKEKGYTKSYFWWGFFGGRAAIRSAEQI